jgi:hypothetical protein
MPTLTTFPPEIRNKIYDLLLIHDEPIPIACPRKKKKNHWWRRKKKQGQEHHTYFASVLRVNKQISLEAKTIFYARNTFIVSTGIGRSETQANHHGFAEFGKRVPKHCLALITRIELDMWIMAPNPHGSLWYEYLDSENLKKDLITLWKMCKFMLVHFTGLEYISAAAQSLYLNTDKTHRQNYQDDDLRYNLHALSLPLQVLLDLPALKRVDVQYDSARNIRDFVSAMLDGKEEAQDKVKMVRRNGTIVPLNMS